MRGTKAKALRKAVYGDISLKLERQYRAEIKSYPHPLKKGLMITKETLINIGPRREYQLAKKALRFR